VIIPLVLDGLQVGVIVKLIGASVVVVVVVVAFSTLPTPEQSELDVPMISIVHPVGPVTVPACASIFIERNLSLINCGGA
jgi:hypothetical protein